jgi:sortase A
LSRDFYLKSLTLIFGLAALLAIGACAVSSSPDVVPEQVENEPTVIPTPTEVPATPTPTRPEATPTATEPASTPEPEATPSPEPEPTEEPAAESDDDAAEQNHAEETNWPGRPVQLRIDRIGVVAGFEWVGITPEGNMDAPEGWDNVGWYEPGTVPGEPGNAVVAGHLDRPGGSPAIFYNLRQLSPGDQIVIQTEHNHELVFEIVEIEVVDANNAPLEKIFGSSDERYLNLITCEGVWDRSSAMYDKRLVVYSKLVSS